MINVKLACRVAGSLSLNISHYKIFMAIARAKNIPLWSTDKHNDSTERLSAAKDWIETCRVNHFLCNQVEKSISPSCPTRLIELTAQAARIICLSSSQSVTYVALSHCWGAGLPIKSTKSTIDGHMININEEMMPKTYQNAIAIARELGYSYIWIDSLCIIQDDAQDWEVEAARMAMVYERADLNDCRCLGCRWALRLL